MHAVNPARILPHPADSPNVALSTLHNALFPLIHPLSAIVLPQRIAGPNANVLSHNVC